MTSVLVKRGNLDTGTQREKMMCEETWGEGSHQPAKERSLEHTLPSQASGANRVKPLLVDFQSPDCETISSCCLSHPGGGTLLQ